MRKTVLIRFVFSLLILLAGISAALVLSILTKEMINETAFAQRNLIRLHVLAHSNLPADQDLKLLVRDAVLEETKNILGGISQKAEARALLEDHQSQLRKAAQDLIFQEGYDYAVQVAIGNFPFPKREYGSLSLPEGNYDAVRVEIGAAAGDNWWCVLFPPLCLAELEGFDSGLVKVDAAGEGPRLALRLKFWQQISQTRYAQTIKNWWRASAAGYSTVLQ